MRVEILIGEHAPFEHLLTRHVEEAAGDLLEIRVRPILILRVLLPVDPDPRVAGEHHAESRRVGDGRVLGIGAQPLHQPVEELLACGRRRVVPVHQAHPRRHQAGRVVAVVDRLLRDDRSQLEQRADQQHAGDDDLEDDQAA
jgi:hypothetical protein